MYLLDTCTVSEIRKVKAGKADQNFADWITRIDASSFYVSSINLMELERGVLSMERKDTAQGGILRAWFNNYVLPEFSHRTLHFDTDAASRCAQMHVPNPAAFRDAMIAATALVHGMAVVTRNVKDFQFDGLKVINPWL
ncbi:VapC toxin family PIN domain ribonuclease [Pokkaliibacter plantistimulans]|uniref:VapC toxin family PIN domain ribonuclease n=1 Tax=Proteobacteria bacterium 228 TaxID=2083153 RepID=A0A2S5KKB9_9PROT|nr:VapC toxin family PIN domain ribonuclease [Pokkaliibacter plantistimulans]